ncbi:MAG: YcbK family protein [Gammaproteobacteria bacterium]
MTEFRANRRKILTAGLALPALSVPSLGYSASAASRRLAFYHTHTGKSLDIVYREGNDYLPNALESIDGFLGDFRTGESYPIDPTLLDQLHDIQRALGTRSRFEIISGYRSPKTNNMLRGKSNGVAKRSLHMQGRALDIRLTDVSTAKLRAAALELKGGGVGYYPKSKFIHIDTGRVRRW